MSDGFEFGIGTLATQQRPLWAAKVRAHHQRWLVVATRDEDCDVDVYTANVECHGDMAMMLRSVPYADLWNQLRRLKLERRKWWMIGWRIRYLLEKSHWLSCLESGELRLPSKKQDDGTVKRTGRLSLGQAITDIDLIAGQNKLRVLDWQNYGLAPEDFHIDVATQTANDCERVFQDFSDGCDAVGLSISRATAAQLGWAKLRDIRCLGTLYVNDDAESRVLERRATYGGRNECFRLGDQPGVTYSLDIASCYAAVCEREPVPTRLLWEYREGLDWQRIDPDGDTHWIADVVVNTEGADYPLQWVNAPIYPVGQFRTVLPWPELRHAIRAAAVVRILRAAEYEAQLALVEYAKWFRRAKAMLVEVGFPHLLPALKAMFNASIGYSSRRSYEWQPWRTDVGRRWVVGTTASPEDNCSPVQAHILDGASEWLKIGGEPRDSLPYIYATVASYARVQLAGLFTWAGRHNVLYCDTDGILVNSIGYANLLDSPGIMGDRPGELRQRFEPGPCRIQGQKNYRIGENTVCAGLVQTRHSQWAEKMVLATPTGRSSVEGIVEPFRFRCDEATGGEENWRNEMC